MKERSNEDLQNIGEALLRALALCYPEYTWLNCPSEVVSDLLHEIDYLKSHVSEEYQRNPEPSSLERLKEETRSEWEKEMRQDAFGERS